MRRIVFDTLNHARFVLRAVVATCLLLVFSACGADNKESATGPATAVEPGPVSVQLGLSELFDPYIFLVPTPDDAGAGDAPDQSDMNSFTRADNVAGRLGVAWTWDDINSWAGAGQSGDACALFDIDAVGTPASQGGGNADYAVCVRIHNPNGDPSQIAQLPQPESPVIYKCSDKKTDRCTTTFTIEQLGGSFCEVVPTAETFPNAPGVGDDGADILAACSIALSAIGNPSRTSLLNVCSFPSGSPNSNNFDCVVTPGSGFIQIKKNTTPQNSSQTFNFTLSPASAGGTTAFSIVDNSTNDETTSLIPVAPGTYSIAEIVPTGWALTNATCTGGTSTANPITGITVGVGETKVCTFTNTQSGGITIVKDATPEDGTDFSFTATGTGVSNFVLDDDADNTRSNTQAFTALGPGSRTISENAVAGWTVTNITCTGATSSTVTMGADNDFDAGETAVSITLAAGENVSCTFENTKNGSITIVKNALPDDAQDFTYTASGTGVTGFTLDDDGAGGSATPSSQAFNNLLPGSRTISEGAASGWTITNINCTGNTSSTVTIGGTGGFNAGDNAVTIDLAAGESITCTFTNTKGGSITIVKNAVPDDGQDFAYTATGTGVTDFTLDDDGAGGSATPSSQPFTGLLPGARTITEGAASGWTITNINCTGHTSSTVTIGATGGFNAGDNAVTIDLAAGESVTCTFTNTKQGSITIVKNAVPDDGQDFTYTATGTGVNDFTLDDDGAGGSATPSSQAFNSLLPGTRTMTEGAASGWTITNINCTGNTNSTVTIGATGGFNAGDNAVTIDLAAGESVTCTFTNTKGGSITIVKNAVPDDAQDFTYTATGTGVTDFTLDDDGAGGSATPNSQPFTGLLPGTRTITEGAASGWTITNINCTGNTSSTVTIGATGGFSAGDNAVTIDLTAGESVTCTFTNTKHGSITIAKNAVPDDAQDFSFTATGTGVNGFTLDDDGAGGSATPSSQAFNSLLPGSRTITETAASGWTITNINCTGNTSSSVTIGATGGFSAGDNAVTIDLAAGEHVSCTFTNTVVAPGVTVVKTASPTSIPETGGTVTYTIEATNNASVAVTLTTLSDDKFGNLDGQGNCDVPQSLASGATYSCSFQKTLAASEAGLTHVNTVTATVTNAGGSANDDDDATVTYTNVNPNISVTKVANPTSLSTVQTGVLTFTADQGRTYLSNTTSTPGTPSFVSPTCDDGGANDINSSQVDLNCFNRADNVADRIHVKWTWDDINAWSGGGSTGDACALIDTDNDGNANVAVCARIQNDAQGNIVQIGGPDAVDVYVCNDTKTDRCAKQTTLLSNTDNGDTKCNISTVGNGFPTGDDGADIEALCEIDRTMPGLPAITNFDLLNVCSFPSGEPNSNPFDCVVQIGAGFIQIIKVASPTTTQQFGFTMSPAATDLTDEFIVAGGVTSAAIPAAPGTAYSLTETLPTNWDISSASCVVDGQSTGTFTLANKRLTGITIKTGQTTVCTFNNTGLISGPVEYTIRVTNLGKENVSLFSLTDDKFGDLNGVGTCTTGGTILGSATGTLYYECKFTKTISGAAGTSHINEVTAVAKDNESPQNSDTKKASATVSFVSPP
jgi:hypothetical protein